VLEGVSVFVGVAVVDGSPDEDKSDFVLVASGGTEDEASFVEECECEDAD
jgi:hypothetical protein